MKNNRNGFYCFQDMLTCGLELLYVIGKMHIAIEGHAITDGYIRPCSVNPHEEEVRENLFYINCGVLLFHFNLF